MRVAVVGAGVIGLTSAVRLLEEGHAVSVFAERATPDTTSDRAGAIFAPFHPSAGERFRHWTWASYRAYRRLVRDHGDASGVAFVPIEELCFEERDRDPWWSEIVDGYERLTDLPHPYRDGFAALVPRVDVRVHLPWLARRVADDPRGEVVLGRIHELDELFDEGFDLVVNASGLGARRLANDDAVFPMRGQTVRVPNNLGLERAYVEEERGRFVTYLIPFEDSIVCGGTYERDEWIDECEERSLVALLDRCQDLLTRVGHPEPERFARRRIAQSAGLRPCREAERDEDAARVEREELADGRAIVHDYGHGRFGITLAWGCAEEVVRLAGPRAALPRAPKPRTDVSALPQEDRARSSG